jgi:energy-coupling factor transport system substrate-specific component
LSEEKIVGTELTAGQKISRIVVASVLTGVGFIASAPFALVPGAIHWRIFAFIPCVVGILWGWRTGFLAGYFGNFLWSLTGYFNIMTLITDCTAVGLTGLIPGLLVKPEECKTKGGMAKAGIVSVISGIIMIPIVSFGMNLIGLAPFWVFVGLLIPSDLPSMIFTGIAVNYLYREERHRTRF